MYLQYVAENTVIKRYFYYISFITKQKNCIEVDKKFDRGNLCLILSFKFK